MTNTILVLDTNKVLSQNSRDSFLDACRRWECDYTEIKASTEPYHHAALKLKAFELCRHDRILVVDSDTVIRSDTPNLFEMTDPKFVYAVQNQQPRYPGAYQQPNVNVAHRDIKAIVDAKGITNVDVDVLSHKFFNSGIVMMSREHHTEIWAKAFEYFSTVPGMQWWDQIPLNVAVWDALGHHKDLGERWNYQFPPGNQSKMIAFIYHYAGNPGRYDILKTINWIHVAEDVQTREQLHVLINSRACQTGAEIGVQNGDYAKYLLENTEMYLYGIDAWQHIEGYNDIANVPDDLHNECQNKALQNLSKYMDRCKLIKAFSVDAAKDFAEGTLDFVYIDADHRYTAALEDLYAWDSKVRLGGIIAGHDFLDGENICGSEFGVRSAVFKWLKGTTYTLRMTDETWPSWFVIKG